MYNYYNADGLLFRMQVLAPNTDSGSERVTKSGVSDLDKYVFFGCHTSGHHYQYYLDHHTDVCLSKQKDKTRKTKKRSRWRTLRKGWTQTGIVFCVGKHV